MGVIMENRIRKYNTIVAILVFIGLPILLVATGESQNRSLLKEAISYLTILSFYMMLAQFFLARSNKKILNGHKMSKIIKLHKIIGYVFVGILIFHPFLIVLPRYFEAGIDPIDAFTTLLTSFNNTGVVLGIIAWCLMFILGLTSLFRNNLGITYKTWRIFHGILSITFIVLASWHVIDLGRHSNNTMTIYILIVTTIAVLLLLRTYLIKPTIQKEA